MKRKLIFGAVALIVICACAFCGCSAKRTINLADYVSVEFSGYSGDGTARVNIDADAMIPLLDNQNSPRTIAESFSAGEVKNNGKLSNGDTITVTVDYNEMLMNNAKINVQNPTLSFTVSGLKEKQKLDVFAGVEFITEGTSPECKINVTYNGGTPYGTLEMQLENGEIVADSFSNRNFKNGEKVTLRVSEKALEKLRTEYIINETSRDYIVQSDSAYILSPADLSDADRQSVDKIAEDFLHNKVQEILNNNDKDARLRLLANVSDVNLGSLYAGISSRVDSLAVKELKSAYVGVGNVSGSWGVEIKNQKSIYYIYDADCSYYIKEVGTKVHEGDTTCALIVRIDDPKITSEGVMYSDIAFASAKDYQTAYNSYITSSFEKLI